jgi:hypothetical protein
MILILTGVLLLLVRLDVVSTDFWWNLIEYFPFVLIAIGIEKIFARTQFKLIAYLSSLLMVAGALYVVIDSQRYGETGSYFESSSIRFDPDEEVTEIAAVLELGDANLTIRNAADELLYARFGQYSFKPEQSLTVADGRAKILLTDRSKQRRLLGGKVVIDGDEVDDWRVSFSRNLPLNLTCSGKGDEIHLNLADTHLRVLSVDASDAEIYIKVGELEPDVIVSVRGIDSELRLRVPEVAGLSIRGFEDNVYPSELGLVENGGEYTTENIEAAETRIQIDLEDEFRSLSIDFY